VTLFEILGTFKIEKGRGMLDLQSIEKTGKQTSSALQNQFKKTGDFLAKSIKVGALAAGAALAGLAVSSLKTYVAYEKGMREVFTLLPGLSDTAKSQMMEDVEELSQAIGILPAEVVPALYQAISAGVPQANVFSFMEVAGKAAKAGVTDLETAVDGLSSVVNAYGRENITAKQAADLFFTTVRLGKTDFEQLSRYLFQVVPTAAAVGVNFGQIAAAMAEITAKGVPTRVAATQLRSLLNELSTAGSDVNEIFTDLVEMSFTDFIETGGDLADVIQILEEYADEMGVSLKDLFSSIEAGGGALNLGGQSLDNFRDKIAQTTDAAGSMEIAYAEMADSVQQQLDELAAWWEVTKIEIGRDLIDDFQELLDFLDANKDTIKITLTSLIAGLIGLLKWLIDNKTAVKAALAVAAVGLAAILGYTHPLLTSVLLLTAGITALVAAFSGSRPEIERWGDTLEETQARLDATNDALLRTQGALGELRENIQELRDAYADIAGDMEGIASSLSVDEFLAAGRAFEEIRSQVIALERELGDEGLTGVFDQFIADLEGAYMLAISEGGEFEAALTRNIQAILDAYSEAYPELAAVLQNIKVEFGESAEGFETYVQRAISASAELARILAEMRAEQERDAALLSQAWINATLHMQRAIGSLKGPITGLFGDLRKAYQGLTEDLPEAERTLLEFAEATGELSEAQQELVDSATATRDEVLSAWTDLTQTLADAAGSFFDSISEMVRYNRDLAASHKKTLDQIDADHKKTYDSLKQQRLDDLADLKKSLNDGTVTREKYSEERKRIEDDYTGAVLTLDQARIDGIKAEEKAYEDAKRTIWDIMQEMGQNLLVAIREELTLQAAKAFILGTAALLNPLTWAIAPGYFAQSAALGAGALGLALAGYEKGGIALGPNVGIFGDTGVPEAVIPLTVGNLSAIGEGIAASLGATATEEVGTMVGGSPVEINIYNPIVDSQERIDDLAVSLQDLFDTRERGKGKVRLRT
jgi:TP901 family phage tail tape measure protein